MIKESHCPLNQGSVVVVDGRCICSKGGACSLEQKTVASATEVNEGEDQPAQAEGSGSQILCTCR